MPIIFFGEEEQITFIYPTALLFPSGLKSNPLLSLLWELGPEGTSRVGGGRGGHLCLSTSDWPQLLQHSGRQACRTAVLRILCRRLDC